MWRAYGALPRPALALLRKGLAPAAAHFPTPLGFVRALIACTLGVSASLLLDCFLYADVGLVKWRAVPGRCHHPHPLVTKSLLFDLQSAVCQTVCAASRKNKAE